MRQTALRGGTGASLNRLRSLRARPTKIGAFSLSEFSCVSITALFKGIHPSEGVNRVLKIVGCGRRKARWHTDVGQRHVAVDQGDRQGIEKKDHGPGTRQEHP